MFVFVHVIINRRKILIAFIFWFPKHAKLFIYVMLKKYIFITNEYVIKLRRRVFTIVNLADTRDTLMGLSR